MKPHPALASLLLFSAPSCFLGVHERLIPNGVYREPTKTESLTVTGSDIEFRLKYVRDEKEVITNRHYHYDLAADGGIRLRGSSNDPLFLFIVIGNEWRLDGTTIVRQHYGAAGKEWVPKGDSVSFALVTSTVR